MPGSDSDRLATALEDAAETAEEAAGEQQRAAGLAREAVREHRAGRTWQEVGATGRLTTLAEVLARSGRKLAGAVGQVRRAWARALAAEGLSTRQIGERFGVSHQRVSALLGRHEEGRREAGHREAGRREAGHREEGRQ